MTRRRRRTDLWPRAWRRRPIAAAVLLLLILVMMWDRLSAPAGSDHDRYHDKTFTCSNVVDGDTIDINIPDGEYPHTRIRLWGVDTPEIAHGSTQTMYYGPEATAFTKSLVEARPVRIVLAPDKTRDKYHRLLAYVYLPDSETMLNEELLRTGHAYADHRFDHPWRQRFGELEDKARKAKAGLWRDLTPQQMPPWRQRYEQWQTSPSN